MARNAGAVRSLFRYDTRAVLVVRRFTMTLLWLVTSLLVIALLMRFGMRVLGVRDDIPFPGLIYAFTAPFVQPLYRFFPVILRFDYYAVEVASLVAAGIVAGAAIALYVLDLALAGETIDR
jgi:uncharacterized protein YggT (Ycf19 family)